MQGRVPRAEPGFLLCPILYALNVGVTHVSAYSPALSLRSWPGTTVVPDTMPFQDLGQAERLRGLNGPLNHPPMPRCNGTWL